MHNFLLNTNCDVLLSLITEKSINLFNRFDICPDFLKIDHLEWKTNEHFLKAENIIKNVHIVNDAAERGIKLLQDFNDNITKDEKQKIYLLQVSPLKFSMYMFILLNISFLFFFKGIQDYRRKYPNSNLQTMKK